MIRIIIAAGIAALVVCLLAGVHVLEDEMGWPLYHPPDGDDDDGCSVLREGEHNADRR